MMPEPAGAAPATVGQIDRKMAAIAILGFSSGLPLALSGSTLEAWCAVSGLSLKTIGAIKLVGLAYVLKVLWSPLVDRFAPPLLGGRRGWMLTMQIAIALVLVAMAGLSPSGSLTGLALLAIALATLSATQDIAVDAYRADQLSAPERGMGAALGVGGYRIAMLVSGGVALILADSFGWRTAYLAMAALMGAGALASYLAPEMPRVARPASMLSAYRDPLIEFLRRPQVALWLALIVLYKLANVMGLALSSTFLLRAAGYSLADVGWVNKIFGLAATLIGVMIGGALLQRFSLLRCLVAFAALQAFSNLGFLAIALGARGMPALIGAVGLENLASGLGTSAFLALLMGLCRKQFSATQYALFSALDSIPRNLIGPIASWAVDGFGWANYFWASIAGGLPALVILYALRSAFVQLESNARQPDQAG